MNRDATDLAGVRHERYDTLGSTNAEALARVRAGERGPLWISAVSQAGGRGRRGQPWSSPPGNLYATLLLTEPSPPAVAPQLSFVAALAAHDAVAACAPGIAPALTLKWPNDLLLDGRKVAGLLVEAESQPVLAVAIGIGINCVSHPAGTAFPATDLWANGATVAVDDLLPALATAMKARLAQWRSGAGFALTRADWLARASGIGQPIRVRLPERQLSGVFQGLDDGGRLLLAMADHTTETIAAGDVFALGR
jgi:BirA family biotin operon repressor/biotin-[acetyl-CoA-carboxylase] ligase